MKILIWLVAFCIFSAPVYAQEQSQYHKPCMMKDWSKVKESLNPLFANTNVPKDIFVERLYEQKGSTEKITRCKLMGFVAISETRGARVKISYSKEGDVADSIIAELGVEFDLPKQEGSH